MLDRLRNNGFSLTEVLMAAGILAIGFAFIAGMFPVGVKLTALSTEQTIAPIVVDEAIAKIKLYGIDPNELSYYSYRLFNRDLLSYNVRTSLYARYTPAEVDALLEDESLYPSADTPLEPKRYNWSALCRRLGQRDVYVIVFVSRKAGAGANYVYYDQDGELQTDGIWPVPVRVGVEVSQTDEQRLTIDADSEQNYISTGSTIVEDDVTGRTYRVIERIRDDDDNVVIELDRDWEGPATGGYVWVVPPAVTSSSPTVRVGGRYPCVRVDPTNTIRF